MGDLDDWLASPARNKKTFDWSKLNAAIQAMAAVAAGKGKAATLERAVARLVKEEPHLFWRDAKKLKPTLIGKLPELAKNADNVEAQLYRATAPKGIATLNAIHRAGDGCDAMVRALAKVKEVSDPDVLAAVRAVLIDTKKLTKGTRIEDVLGDEGRRGLIAIAMLADDVEALGPLLGNAKLVSANREDLFSMVKAANAKNVLKMLRGEKTSAKAARARPSEQWATSLGLKTKEDTWEVTIKIKSRGGQGVYAPSFSISIGGNEGEDWCVRTTHEDHGTSTCLAGKMINDESRLGAIKSIDQIPTWITKSQRKLKVEWLLDSARITAPSAAWKSKIAAWVKTLSA